MDRQLIDYLPPIMRTYAEIQQICNAEQKVKEKMRDDLYTAFDQSFVSTQNESGIKRWEKTLGIEAKATDTIIFRNNRIKSKLHEDLPYTYRTFKKQLATLTNNDYKMSIDYDRYNVNIKVGLEEQELINEVAKLSDRMLPAHLSFDVEVLYNTHEFLSGYPYRILRQFTNKELRELVINDYLSSSVDTISEYTVDDIEQYNVDELENYGLRIGVNE